jgi:hypothetical protein
LSLNRFAPEANITNTIFVLQMLVVYFIGFNTWRTTHLKDHVAAGRLSHQKHWKALKRSGACDDVCNIWKNWTDV